MKIFYFLMFTFFFSINSLMADNFVIRTQNTMLFLSGSKEKPLRFRYFGDAVVDIAGIETTGSLFNTEAYPAFGIRTVEEKALHVTHADGNISAVLHMQSYTLEQIDSNVSIHKFIMKDPQYPFFVTLYYKTYFREDVFEVWTEISHHESKPVILSKYASFQIPVNGTAFWLSHFNGGWGGEFGLTEKKLDFGMTVIKNREGIRTTQTSNPSFMLTLGEKPSEDHGNVIAGALAYTGNFKFSFDRIWNGGLNIIAGINEDASQYRLEKNEVFKTPKFILTYSSRGKGEVSRNLHQWARQYKIIDGYNERMILLNSWEGVYFNTQEKTMLDMIDDIADMGAELFVMDDGWFGEKYPRNDGTSSLGDWVVDTSKLPNGLQPLIDRATAKGIKFGIWLEPEMTNDKSELYEKHPEWVIGQTNRELVKGRGESQLTLDMSNPEVQDFVYSTIHNLLIKHPKIAYIKWDANRFIANYGSRVLSADKQSHLFIEYHRGLLKTLERIRKEHPHIIMQACASGGGRISYGYLPYFHEFWTSDNTDALTRLYMQWGVSHFFPANTMASHVSTSPNHQTGRMLPLKFRIDVAMTGRFGLELQPKDLKPDEKIFTKNAIKTYKKIRHIVQLGDLYRIDSPFDNNSMASLIYVTQDKRKAVFFCFITHSWQGNSEVSIVPKGTIPTAVLANSKSAFKLKGLNPDKNYKLLELNKEGKGKLIPDGKVLTGNALMKVGVSFSWFRRQYNSGVIMIEEVEN